VLLISAITISLLTILGAAGEAIGHDKWLKTNTEISSSRLRVETDSTTTRRRRRRCARAPRGGLDNPAAGDY
jgi:hypothetical protein